MKRNNRMRNLMTQFSYEHKKMDSRLIKIKQSAEEVSRLLNNMTKSDEK